MENRYTQNYPRFSQTMYSNEGFGVNEGHRPNFRGQNSPNRPNSYRRSFHLQPSRFEQNNYQRGYQGDRGQNFSGYYNPNRWQGPSHYPRSNPSLQGYYHYETGYGRPQNQTQYRRQSYQPNGRFQRGNKHFGQKNNSKGQVKKQETTNNTNKPQNKITICQKSMEESKTELKSNTPVKNSETKKLPEETVHIDEENKENIELNESVKKSESYEKLNIKPAEEVEAEKDSDNNERSEEDKAVIIEDKVEDTITQHKTEDDHVESLVEKLDELALKSEEASSVVEKIEPVPKKELKEENAFDSSVIQYIKTPKNKKKTKDDQVLTPVRRSTRLISKNEEIVKSGKKNAS